MSHHHHSKRQRSRSRSSTNKQESQSNRNKDYDRRSDSYERHHHSSSSNRQYNYHSQPDLPVSIDGMINHPEEYPPTFQLLVRELTLEQKKRKLVEERLTICQYNYANLRAQHEQTLHNLTLLKHDFDKCRMELSQTRHLNSQLRTHIDHLLNNDRQQNSTENGGFYTKRQRRH